MDRTEEGSPFRPTRTQDSENSRWLLAKCLLRSPQEERTRKRGDPHPSGLSDQISVPLRLRLGVSAACRKSNSIETHGDLLPAMLASFGRGLARAYIHRLARERNAACYVTFRGRLLHLLSTESERSSVPRQGLAFRLHRIIAIFAERAIINQESSASESKTTFSIALSLSNAPPLSCVAATLQK